MNIAKQECFDHRRQPRHRPPRFVDEALRRGAKAGLRGGAPARSSTPTRRVDARWCLT